MIGYNVQCAELKFVGSRNKLAGVHEAKVIHLVVAVAVSEVDDAIQIVASAIKSTKRSNRKSLFLFFLISSQMKITFY